MSVRNGMRPLHPGEVLREEIDALDMSANTLAQELDVPPNRITAILNGVPGELLFKQQTEKCKGIRTG